MSPEFKYIKITNKQKNSKKFNKIYNNNKIRFDILINYIINNSSSNKTINEVK
jgi:hypothetical protein